MTSSFEYIPFIVITIVGAIVIYKFDLKIMWQDNRKSNGITDKDDNEPLHLLSKCEYEKKRIYTSACFSLLALALSFSLCITLLYVILNLDVTFDGIRDYARVSISFIFIYGIFMGFSKKSKDENDIMQNLFDILYKIKEKVILGIISKEIKQKRRFIESRISARVFSRTKDKDVRLGTLVLRIKEDYLLKLLPCDEEPSELTDLKLEIVALYLKESATVEDELIDFFNRKITDKKIGICEVLKFIVKVESASRSFTSINDVNKKIGNIPVKTKKNVKSIKNIKPSDFLNFDFYLDEISEDSLEPFTDSSDI